MIWCPNNGDECVHVASPRLKSVFLMVPTPKAEDHDLRELESNLRRTIESQEFEVVVARKEGRSSNLLCKICEMIQSTSISIVVYAKGSRKSTIANIFYEAGIAHMLGKEVIFVGLGVKRTSDLAGVEWIETKTPRGVRVPLRKRLKGMPERADYYTVLGENEEKSGNLEKAAQYFMRAILLSNDSRARSNLSDILTPMGENEALQKAHERASSFNRFVTRTPSAGHS